MDLRFQKGNSVWLATLPDIPGDPGYDVLRQHDLVPELEQKPLAISDDEDLKKLDASEAARLPQELYERWRELQGAKPKYHRIL